MIALARDVVRRKYCSMVSFVKSNEDHGVLAKHIVITIANVA